ncbi:15881_t:CDS:2 [Gigaspora margarita]|uniref:15881_t:CDS:1 n=1 Tax=Gigaspora margarita TaxID=4874 RepID=A0ABM8VZQ1_GIGMA|nr:15881_t:CDS:2 [Gigaspora margarita]
MTETKIAESRISKEYYLEIQVEFGDKELTTKVNEKIINLLLEYHKKPVQIRNIVEKGRVIVRLKKIKKAIKDHYQEWIKEYPKDKEE